MGFGSMHSGREKFHSFAVIVAALLCGAAARLMAGPADTPSHDLTTMLPRTLLFGNPDRIAVRISPDARWLSWLAPYDGVLNVWLAPVKDPSLARAVTRDKGRGITGYDWGKDGNRLLFVQDRDGDENYHLYLVVPDEAFYQEPPPEPRDLTPYPNTRARIIALSHATPSFGLIGMNDRDATWHDIYRVDLSTGERKLVERGDNIGEVLADDALNLRVASHPLPDGGFTYSVRRTPESEWEEYLTLTSEDAMNTAPEAVSVDGRTMYLMDSRSSDTNTLKAINLSDLTETTLFNDARCDIVDLLKHPRTGRVEAAASLYEKRLWNPIAPELKEDFDALSTLDSGDLSITSRGIDPATGSEWWIVATGRDIGPTRFFVYDREHRTASFLFSSRQQLDDKPLAPMHPRVVSARDGLKLISYLTLPHGSDPDGDGVPSSPVPLVLNVHGGPWGRDKWGFDPVHQWLASRGYAVMSVNFRGSTGLGKAFLNAGTHEWGGKMHTDLLDVVDWAVTQNIAPKDRVAIMGGSYGGYAALVGMTMTPDVFACGISVVGPSNLATLLASVPPYWKATYQLFVSRIGDPATAEGRKLLLDRSPLTHVDRISRPLLIAQGANDPRVKRAESEQIVAAMTERHLPVTYLLFPDEGHGLVRPENRLAYYAVAEAFLAQNLGGALEPIDQDASGGSMQIPTGREHIPALAKPTAAMDAPPVRALAGE